MSTAPPPHPPPVNEPSSTNTSTTSSSTSANHPQKREAREALVATGVLLLSLAILKPLGALVPVAQEGVFIFAVAFQLYVPQILLARRKTRPEDIGIHVHGALLGPLASWRRHRVFKRRKKPMQRRKKSQSAFDLWLASWARGAQANGPAIQKELWRVALLCAFFFPLFALGHHFWQQELLGGRTYHFRLPKDLLELLIINVALVATAEEVFYRGFLENRLDRLWPDTRAFWGIPLTRSVFLASALFALGHFLGEWNVARLAPFFPAFIFSGLARQGGSLLGAILFHGLSNVFSTILLAGYALS